MCKRSRVLALPVVVLRAYTVMWSSGSISNAAERNNVQVRAPYTRGRGSEAEAGWPVPGGCGEEEGVSRGMACVLAAPAVYTHRERRTGRPGQGTQG